MEQTGKEQLVAYDVSVLILQELKTVSNRLDVVEEQVTGGKKKSGGRRNTAKLSSNNDL